MITGLAEKAFDKSLARRYECRFEIHSMDSSATNRNTLRTALLHVVHLLQRTGAGSRPFAPATAPSVRDALDFLLRRY